MLNLLCFSFSNINFNCVWQVVKYRKKEFNLIKVRMLLIFNTVRLHFKKYIIFTQKLVTKQNRKEDKLTKNIQTGAWSLEGEN